LFDAYNQTADSDGTSDESDPDPIVQEAGPLLITDATAQGMAMLYSICRVSQCFQSYHHILLMYKTYFIGLLNFNTCH